MAPKNMGSRRYAFDIAALGRCRNGILLDVGLQPDTVKTALAQIDALLVSLSALKRQREATEIEDEEKSTGTDGSDARR